MADRVERMLATVDNILKNTYEYGGKNYAIGIYNRSSYQASVFTFHDMKSMVKELEQFGLVKKTRHRLKNAPAELQTLIAAQNKHNKYKGKLSRAYLQAFIYLCNAEKLKKYRDSIARELKGQTE